ncbi:fanconi-associated nuclease 1 homolog isoform X2 [Diabrotica virgifera virgifera]|uniref:Fanconi-associated nuclease n=1 Tax=Diabrotica virgifera virgifera TaxID=50390 RepID=A0A6P7G4G9_DIAVI|nr:fanconi-associated nuclease 1 homolog isoform X2 [Diabrotica virgifera virgifera]
MRKSNKVTPDKLKQSRIVDYYSKQKPLNNMGDESANQPPEVTKRKSRKNHSMSTEELQDILEGNGDLLVPVYISPSEDVRTNEEELANYVCKDDVILPDVAETTSTSYSHLNKDCAGHTNGTSYPTANSSKSRSKGSPSSKRCSENQNKPVAMSQPPPKKKKAADTTANIRNTTTSNPNDWNQNESTPSTSTMSNQNDENQNEPTPSTSTMSNQNDENENEPTPIISNQNDENQKEPTPSTPTTSNQNDENQIGSTPSTSTMSNQNDGNQNESTPSTSTMSNQTPSTSRTKSIVSHANGTTSHPTTNSKKKSRIVRASPKKDENKMNDDFLTMMNDIFTTVFPTQQEDQNLVQVIDDKAKQRWDILKDAKKEYQFICYKLYTRIPTWRSIFTLRKDHMPNLSDKNAIEVFNFLEEKQFVDTDYNKDRMEELLGQLPAKDVKNICLHLKIKPSTPKKNIDILLDRCRRQPTLSGGIKSTREIIFDQIEAKLGKYALKINDSFKKDINRIYLLATFTNNRFQNIENFLGRDLKCDFPSFVVEKYKVFRDVQEFLRYAEACELRQTLETTKNHETIQEIGMNVKDKLKALERTNDEMYFNAPHLKRFTAESVYCGILTNICEILKTTYVEEVQAFLEYLIENFPRSHRIGTWYMLLCDIFTSRNLSSEAVNVIITALRTKKEYILEYQIYEFAHKAQALKKSKQIEQYTHDQLVELLPDPINSECFPQARIDAKIIKDNPCGRKRHYEVNNSGERKSYETVEDVAKGYYIIETGAYTDGKDFTLIIMNSFTLFFWDIIYSQNPNITGTFLSKYQEVPLDMYTTDFYKNRKELIDKRLKNIAEGWTYEVTIQNVTEHWQNYSHISGLCGPIVKTMDIKFLKLIVDCIGREILSKIYERLVKDIHQYQDIDKYQDIDQIQSGMPDLFLWNVDEKKAKFVVVKEENDLSIKQKLWLKYLNLIGANAEVCHVLCTRSKRTATDSNNN